MGKKTSCLLDKKVRKKNHILEYDVPSPKELMRIIYEQLIDEKSPNPLKTEKENQKIYDW